MEKSDRIDLLNDLVLPDRYERLTARVGADVVNVLVAPPDEFMGELELLAEEIAVRDEGVLLPLVGTTGEGKTTITSSLTNWNPQRFGPTLKYDGKIEFEEMASAVKEHLRYQPTNEDRIIPINLDHREDKPPAVAERATIKRFLRERPHGPPALVIWPFTDYAAAEETADAYRDIAGRTSIDLPLKVQGPPRDGWISITKETLELANDFSGLEQLGVAPAAYDPDAYPSLGEFIRSISIDFKRELIRLRKTLDRDLELIIAVVSESSEPGVLSELVNPSRYGVLDPTALVAVTPESVIGKWWKERMGLLIRAVVSLNARVVAVGPAASVSVARNCHDGEADFFDDIDFPRRGPKRGARDLARSDLGKMLLAHDVSRFESRGTPATESEAAFQLLAERGFNLGADKNLNRIMAAGIKRMLEEEGVPFRDVQAESKLPFCSLIPDNTVDLDGERVICLEYTWRKGPFLLPGNRAAIAGYILEKLQNYVRELGWTRE